MAQPLNPRFLLTAAAASLIGCASVSTVERHPLKASDEQIMSAVNDVSTRLQWSRRESPTLKPGQLEFLVLPDRLVASAEHSELVVEAPARFTKTVNGEVHRYPGYMVQVLSQATAQTLDPASVPEGAHLIAPRLRPLALVLDLVEPAVGAAYAIPGDPYMEGDGNGWYVPIVIRGLVDVAGAGALLFGATRSPALGAPMGVGIGILAASRLFFATVDWFVVGRRNVVADSGYKFLLKPPE